MCFWWFLELLKTAIYCDFMRFTFFNILDSIGICHVFWHLLILRFCHFTILPFSLFWVDFDISQLEMIMASELHNQVLDSCHCGIFRWWTMLRLLYSTHDEGNLENNKLLLFMSARRNHGKHNEHLGFDGNLNNKTWIVLGTCGKHEENIRFPWEPMENTMNTYVFRWNPSKH